MNRTDVMTRLEELWERADRENIGSNEAELEFRELVADWIMTMNVGKYHYKQVLTTCVEQCKLIEGARIGSSLCVACHHCLDNGRNWIKCDAIEEAISHE